ncbi:MAG: NAD+ kinase [Polaribacter sp.]|jgi:NAD+ kinase
MKVKFNTIGLVVRQDIESRFDTVLTVVSALSKHADVLVHCLDFKTPTNDLTTVALKSLVKQSDLVISLGGDGTLLAAARALVNMDTPLLGINLGRLGFLADVSISDFESHIAAVVAGKYTVEKRFFIEGEIRYADKSTYSNIALNDIILHSHESLSMIEYEVHCNGSLIHKQRADGVIVTTPTGSTAYALSGGGPIMHPSLEALAIVPVCPHTLTNRPIVIPASQAIEVRLSQASSLANINYDGRSTKVLDHTSKITIRRYPQLLTLLHPEDYDYFGIVRAKLQWSSHH